KLTLVSGEPGLGKSQLSLDIAARVTTGNPWPDGRGINQAGSVVLLSAEDDIEDTIVPRLNSAGAALHRITAIQGIEVSIDGPAKRRCFSLESDLPQLEQAIASFEDTRSGRPAIGTRAGVRRRAPRSRRSWPTSTCGGSCWAGNNAATKRSSRPGS